MPRELCKKNTDLFLTAIFSLLFFLIGCDEGYSRRHDPVEIARRDSIAKASTIDDFDLNGKMYTHCLHIIFAEEVFPKDTVKYYDLHDMQWGHGQFKSYLESMGDVIFLKGFPKAIWGDTVRTNRTGQTVFVHNLAGSFRIFFPLPVQREEVRNALETFSEVKRTGAWVRVHIMPL